MAGGSTGMWCYDSAGDATQCQDGAHSCVTFVELTQSNVSGNVSAGPFLNKDTRKCGTSRVFEHSDPVFFTTADSPMCDPDLCEVVVEAPREGGSEFDLYAIVIPFGPHPSRETEHKDSRTVDPIWQYQIGYVYFPLTQDGRPYTPKCVPKNTATCFNNFKAAFVANPDGRPEGPVCEATPGCTWDAISTFPSPGAADAGIAERWGTRCHVSAHATRTHKRARTHVHTHAHTRTRMHARAHELHTEIQ